LSALVEDLRRVHERLERTADAAEQNQLHLAVASVSSQQLRATELRAKMGSVGGFAPQAKGRDGADEKPFTIVFQLPAKADQSIDLRPANNPFNWRRDESRPLAPAPACWAPSQASGVASHPRAVADLTTPSRGRVIRFPEIVPTATDEDSELDGD